MLILSAIMLTASYPGFRHPSKLSLVAKDSYLSLLHGIHPYFGSSRYDYETMWYPTKRHLSQMAGLEKEKETSGGTDLSPRRPGPHHPQVVSKMVPQIQSSCRCLYHHGTVVLVLHWDLRRNGIRLL